MSAMMLLIIAGGAAVVVGLVIGLIILFAGIGRK